LKAALCYGSENWIIHVVKKDAQELEAAEMRFLRTLLDHQRNLGIRSRLKANNLTEGGYNRWEELTEAIYPD
jgi:hypothetical protein